MDKGAGLDGEFADLGQAAFASDPAIACFSAATMG